MYHHLVSSLQSTAIYITQSQTRHRHARAPAPAAPSARPRSGTRGDQGSASRCAPPTGGRYSSRGGCRWAGPAPRSRPVCVWGVCVYWVERSDVEKQRGYLSHFDGKQRRRTGAGRREEPVMNRRSLTRVSGEASSMKAHSHSICRFAVGTTLLAVGKCKLHDKGFCDHRALPYLGGVLVVAGLIGGVRPPAVRHQSHRIRLLALAADGRAELRRGEGLSISS